MLAVIVTEPLDPNDLVTVEELALSTLWATAALGEGLGRSGGS